MLFHLTGKRNVKQGAVITTITVVTPITVITMMVSIYDIQ